MRAPRFWQGPGVGTMATLLRPASALYGAIAASRLRRSGVRLDVPVICVGNFTAGGTGKTPVALWVTQTLRERGLRPALLSRGFGRNGRGLLKVDPCHHNALEVGDEPLLLAEVAPTFVADDRLAGARAAVAQGANILVMDDGLQNPSLAKTLSLAVVDASAGFGNGCVMPAGPLRAPLADQWPLVDALVIVGAGGDAVAKMAAAHGKIVLRAVLQPDIATSTRLQGSNLVAFAGIGRPEKFYNTLREAGCTISAFRGFGDHHRFSAGNLADLRALAVAHNAQLVTTSKDYARLPADERRDVMAFPVELVLSEPDKFNALLALRIDGKSLPTDGEGP